MLAEAAGLGIGIGLLLGALGGGGGVLVVPALVYVLGQNGQDATTSSIVIVGLTAGAGAIQRLRGGTLEWRMGLVFGVLGIPGAYLGTRLNHHVPQHVLMLGFAAVTLAAAVAMFAGNRCSRANDRGSSVGDGDGDGDGNGNGEGNGDGNGNGDGDGAARCGDRPAGREPWTPDSGSTLTRTRAAVSATGGRSPARPSGRPSVRTAKVVACAVGIGFMTGFLGVGGGFLVVPALVIVLAMPMEEAVGASLMIITLNSVSSLAARVGDTHFDWRIVVPFTLAAILASVLGKRIADRFSGEALMRAFSAVLVAVAGLVAVQSLGAF